MEVQVCHPLSPQVDLAMTTGETNRKYVSPQAKRALTHQRVRRTIAKKQNV